MDTRNEDSRGGRDPIALTLTVLPLAILAGTAVVAATVLGVRLLQSGEPASPTAAGAAAAVIDFGSPAAILLLAGTFAGPAVAAATAFVLLGPIDNFYRRGMFAMVCAFATIVTMLLCFPAHRLFGSAGLVGLIVLCLVGVTALGRRLPRAGP
jgi:hypothetical protein